MYTQQVRTREGYLQYLDEWIHAVPDHNAYLDKVGRDRLDELRAKPQFCQPVNYGY
jgi:glutaconate CoA-transferase subunit A